MYNIYENNNNNTLDSLYKGADIHKKVRQFIKPYLIPGIKIVDVAKLIEYKTRQLTEELSINNNYKSINYGIGFPACLSLNNVETVLSGLKIVYDNNDNLLGQVNSIVNNASLYLDAASSIAGTNVTPIWKNINIYSNLFSNVQQEVFGQILPLSY